MSTMLPLLVQQQHGGVIASGTPSQYATYSVQVDWDNDDDYTGTYDQLVGMSGYGVKSVRIRRGRDDELSQMVAGEATIVLHDPDGRFNPSNASSPLDGLILPMRKVYITASNDGGATTYPLFGGFIRSVEHNPERGVQETTINCIDQFARFSRKLAYADVSGFGNYTTGEAIFYFVNLDNATGDTSEVSLLGDDLANVSNRLLYATGERSILDEIQRFLELERGTFWMNSAGNPHYETRYAKGARSSSATFTDVMVGARPGIDLDAIGNYAQVTKTGNTAQEASDATSIAAYGRSDITPIDSELLIDDSQAAALASYLVATRKDPRPPIYGLDLMNRDADTMTQILTRELQDRITIVDTRGGTSGDYHIESITHDISDGGKFHRCTWGCSLRQAEAFVVGVSTVGGTDVLSY